MSDMAIVVFPTGHYQVMPVVIRHVHEPPSGCYCNDVDSLLASRLPSLEAGFFFFTECFVHIQLQGFSHKVFT